MVYVTQAPQAADCRGRGTASWIQHYIYTPAVRQQKTPQDHALPLYTSDPTVVSHECFFHQTL